LATKLSIRTCLVCEEIRSEVGNKFAVLGLFGPTPDVNIHLSNANGTVPRLAFLLFGERTTQPIDITLSAQLRDINELGKVTVLVPETKVEMKAGMMPVLGFGIINVKFPRLGKYTLELLDKDDNAVIFAAEFGVRVLAKDSSEVQTLEVAASESS
jgi:hypothetical protein